MSTSPFFFLITLNVLIKFTLLFIVVVFVVGNAVDVVVVFVVGNVVDVVVVLVVVVVATLRFTFIKGRNTFLKLHRGFLHAGC